MAKESVDFVFKADTKDIDKAFKTVADRLENIGKGTKIKLDGLDVKSILDSVKSVQTVLQQLGSTSGGADFSTILKELSQSLHDVENTVSSIDLTKPFSEAQPVIQQLVKELQSIVGHLPQLDGLKLDIDFPADTFDPLIAALGSVVASLDTLTTTLGSLPVESLEQITETFDNVTESIDASTESLDEFAESLDEVGNEAEEALASFAEDIDATNKEILEAAKNIEAMEEAISGIDPVLIDTDAVKLELEQTQNQLEELRQILSQPIPLDLDESGLQSYQEAMADAAVGVMELTQRCRNLEAQIRANEKAVEKFGQAQENINKASASLREFGSLMGLDTSGLESSLGKLSQTIGYLPMVTTAAGSGFVGMATKAKVAIATMTKAMLANPITAILVAISVALAAVVVGWSKFTGMQAEWTEQSKKLAEALGKQTTAIEQATVARLKTREDLQRSLEEKLQDLRRSHEMEIRKLRMETTRADMEASQLRHKQEMERQKALAKFKEMMAQSKTTEEAARKGDVAKADTEKRKELQKDDIGFSYYDRFFGSGMGYYNKQTGEQLNVARDSSTGWWSNYTGAAAREDIMDQNKRAIEKNDQTEARAMEFEKSMGRLTDYTEPHVGYMNETQQRESKELMESIARKEAEIARMRKENVQIQASQVEKRSDGKHYFRDRQFKTKDEAESFASQFKEGNQKAVENRAKDYHEEIKNNRETLDKLLDEAIRVRETQEHAAQRLQELYTNQYNSLLKGDISEKTPDDFRRERERRSNEQQRIMQESDTNLSEDELKQIKEQNDFEREEEAKRHAEASRAEKELFDTRLAHEQELWDFQRETWAKNKASAREIAKMQINHELELRSMQRQSANRMLDLKLDAEIARGDRYGKSNLQQRREQRDIQNKMGDEQSRQRLKTAEKSEKAEAEMAHMKKVREEAAALERKQLAERQKMEMELINEKAKMEEEWIKKEFALRRDLIAQEVAYKTMLEAKAAMDNETDPAKKQELEKKYEQAKTTSDKADKAAEDSMIRNNTAKERAEFAAKQKARQDDLAAKQSNQTKDLEHDQDMRKRKQDAEIEDKYADKNAALERNIRARDALNRIGDAEQDRRIERQKMEEDAMFAKRNEERGLRKNLALSLVNAKSGSDRMQAMDDYRRDMAVSDQKAQIEAQTREQVERAKNSGADEVALNRIEKRSEEMIAALEDRNEIQKAMRDQWMSGLQNAGQKEDVASAWERIQEAAFSRMTDPAAEAVTLMDRNEAMRNAQMMNFYKEWFPKMANSNYGLAPD